MKHCIPGSTVRRKTITVYIEDAVEVRGKRGKIGRINKAGLSRGEMFKPGQGEEKLRGNEGRND